MSARKFFRLDLHGIVSWQFLLTPLCSCLTNKKSHRVFMGFFVFVEEKVGLMIDPGFQDF